MSGAQPIRAWIARQSWRVKGALLLGACVLLTLLSPVLSFSCARDIEGNVGCRVTRHAFGIVPYWWTTIARVGDADSQFSSGGVRRRAGGSSGDKAYYMSRSVVALRDLDVDDWHEWTTWADVGADGIAIAIDELVEGRRTAPFLGWRANVWTILLVFCGAVPFAAAMLRGDLRARLAAKRGTATDRTYATALALGALFALAVWWGTIPAFIAEPLGLPTGWSPGG